MEEGVSKLTHASPRAPLEHKHGIIPQHAPLPSLFVCSSINTHLLVCRFPVGVLQERRCRRQGGADDTFVFQTRGATCCFEATERPRREQIQVLISSGSLPGIDRSKPDLHADVQRSRTVSEQLCLLALALSETCVFLSEKPRLEAVWGELECYSFWKKQINSSTFSTMRSY